MAIERSLPGVVQPGMSRSPASTRRLPAAWWCGAAVALSLIAEMVFMHASWFFLDDVRNLAEARREGLSWHFLIAPIGQHFTPGHRFLDWLSAVPLDRSWSGAILIIVVFTAVMLAYLAGILALLFGAHKRNAIAVLLAGTAWPLLGTAQWFAGGSLAIPVAAAITGAVFHHVRWRLRSQRHDWVCAAAWTVIALLFSEQAILIPAVLFVFSLAACPRRPDRRTVRTEIVAVLPSIAAALALALYEKAQPWAASAAVPSVSDAVELVKVIAVRALLPGLAGIGMDGAPPDPSREVIMRALMAGVVVGAFIAAVWLHKRWLLAALLAGCGAVLTALPIGAARLGLGVSISGSEPRYLLLAVLFTAVAVGALLSPQPDRQPRTLAGTVPVTAVLGIAWAAVYVANLTYTYHARRVALNFAQASHRLTVRLADGLERVIRTGYANTLVDGTLPFPLFYPQASGNLRSAYSSFFVGEQLQTPGVPGSRGELLSIADNGVVEPTAFKATGPTITCRKQRTCSIPTRTDGPASSSQALRFRLNQPALPGNLLHYHVDGPPDASPDRTLTIPAGATSFVVPSTDAEPQRVVLTFTDRLLRVRSVEAGTVQPQPGAG